MKGTRHDVREALAKIQELDPRERVALVRALARLVREQEGEREAWQTLRGGKG